MSVMAHSLLNVIIIFCQGLKLSLKLSVIYEQKKKKKKKRSYKDQNGPNV